MKAGPTLAELRAYAIKRSLFGPTTLGRAIAKLGFVQADPIRAPARAQDLTLRHRVASYRAGDLEKRYSKLAIEEDFFVNYGYLPRATQALMHPRKPRAAWTSANEKAAREVLAFVREQGVAHPREVDAQFAKGSASNWFGGKSSVTTQLLDTLHYRGLLRVARRDSGIRVYALAHETPADHEETASQIVLDRLVDVVVHKYAPLPAASLGQLISRLMVGVPQWQALRATALERAKLRLAHVCTDGIDWYWPAHERIGSNAGSSGQARLLAPFDPVVWDRRRFEIFWGWAYRFEAYTPPPRRKLGYYALPLLWQDQIVGWGNVSLKDGLAQAEVGLANGHRMSRDLRGALDLEMANMAEFLGAEESAWRMIKP